MTKANAAALGYLLRRLNDNREHAKEYWQARDHIHATFDRHPFGHEVDLPREGNMAGTTYLVQDTSGTDRAVQALLLMLEHELTSVNVNDMIFRLRITRVQIDRDWNDKSRFVHDLYFELISWNGTFICGGCNDCTGSGGSGGRELEAIFNLVGSLLQIPVEEIVIPVGRREEIDALFQDTYSRHYHARHAA
jgi:hypothetical protein